MSAWTDPEWRAEADAWIEAQLGRLGLEPTGAFDQVHDRPWATVIRVPTAAGNVFFKAVAPPLRHEAALTELVGRRRPDCVPPPLAVDATRGWLLMVDGGQMLRDLIASERDLTRWLDVLPLYGSLQRDLVDDVDGLIALGVPDLRLAVLPARTEAMLEDLADRGDDELRRVAAAMPHVREQCAELAAFGLPETIEHDDLHDAQVFVRDGRYLLLDWGDACVTHPFFTMAVTLDGVIAWGLDDVERSEDTVPYRDAYLASFAGVASDDDLVAACTIARRLGWLCRAVNGHQGGHEPADRAMTRLRMFLDGTA